MNAQGNQWDCGCIPDRACERTGCPVGFEMDQESIGIVLVYVCVREGGVGRLECGFVLLHSILYTLYPIFYILYPISYILFSILSIFYAQNWEIFYKTEQDQGTVP